ncbi:MAG TPA: NupC/NupG family nucleoside CNT transporter [Deltaproteobacteria bacterium]|nr:NupC/NupG family nucleoside CNT transporter [Deltaproteobacteria bacterium]HCP46041.1 NupC/NupG family nucleoside CNT transporter [Deltaproteobacteria bacterium]
MLASKKQEATPLSARLQSLFGIVLLLGIAWGLSTNRRIIPWRVILWGLGLQFFFALLVLKTGPGEWLFAQLNDLVMTLLGFTTEGARFIFGNLVDHQVPVGLVDPTNPGAPMVSPEHAGAAGMQTVASTGAFFAFNVLPTIIFFSSLMAVLYHLGVMQLLVRAMAVVMFRTMGTSGAESLSAAANIFVGQTEAPLVVRPFIERMTMSELNAVMTGGFATVAGGVMAAYVGMLAGVFPDIAGHLIAASVMSAPAALVIAKLMWPEEGKPVTHGELSISVQREDVNVIDAAARGAGDGMKLALNVAAMLLAFLALVAMLNAIVGELGGLVGAPNLTLEVMVGYIFWPMAWSMGVPAAECVAVGELLGIKVILNEFVAYLRLGDLAEGLSYRSMVIVTYALCGFANLGSIGIQLGGIGGIAPNRRSDLARVGFRAMIAGTLAAFLTANVAGALVG